jgi:ribosomal protein S18 acetylase RimI-like enzyme
VALMLVDALTEADLPAAAALLATEGWTFTPKELARVVATGPGLSVAARDPGLVGVVMVARHGSLAWIGNVLTAASQRGKGLGQSLVAEALRRIEAAGIPTTKLCSVPKAESLYRRLGFRDEAPIHTFAAWHERPTSRPTDVEVLFSEDLTEMAALDHAAFGGDRRALLGMLLRDYSDTNVGVRRAGRLVGFAFLKAGSEGSELGPVVMRDADRSLAAWLLDGALNFRLEGSASRVECSIPARHPWMRALLEERGFAYQDAKLLMERGERREQDWQRCSALAGLEKG